VASCAAHCVVCMAHAWTRANALVTGPSMSVPARRATPGIINPRLPPRRRSGPCLSYKRDAEGVTYLFLRAFRAGGPPGPLGRLMDLVAVPALVGPGLTPWITTSLPPPTEAMGLKGNLILGPGALGLPALALRRVRESWGPQCLLITMPKRCCGSSRRGVTTPPVLQSDGRGSRKTPDGPSWTCHWASHRGCALVPTRRRACSPKDSVTGGHERPEGRRPSWTRSVQELRGDLRGPKPSRASSDLGHYAARYLSRSRTSRDAVRHRCRPGEQPVRRSGGSRRGGRLSSPAHWHTKPTRLRRTWLPSAHRGSRSIGGAVMASTSSLGHVANELIVASKVRLGPPRPGPTALGVRPHLSRT
jgi:hypothetical protein